VGLARVSYKRYIYIYALRGKKYTDGTFSVGRLRLLGDVLGLLGSLDTDLTGNRLELLPEQADNADCVGKLILQGG